MSIGRTALILGLGVCLASACDKKKAPLAAKEDASVVEAATGSADASVGIPRYEESVQVAEAILTGQYESARKFFGSHIRPAFTVERLEQLHKRLLQDYGDFVAIRDAYKATIVADHWIVVAEFAKGKADLHIPYVNGRGVVWLSVDAHHPRYEVPKYLQDPAVTQQQVEVANGEWKLPAMLVLPREQDPKAIVVLVHGFGPQDGDGAHGPLKPLRDWALGLAAHGIAVLRYEKRTWTYRVRLQSEKPLFTPEFEVIDDAIAAVAMARQVVGEKGRVFVMGFGLGGMVLPQIASKAEVSGLVFASTPTEAAHEVVYNRLMAAIGEGGNEKTEEIVSKAKAEREKIAQLTQGGDERLEVLGANVGYWFALRDAAPQKSKTFQQRPSLVLLGSHDEPAWVRDGKRWQEAANEAKAARVEQFAQLNRDFMALPAPAVQLSSQRPGHVAPKAVDTVAGWILGSEATDE